jgi:hypothetical protein
VEAQAEVTINISAANNQKIRKDFILLLITFLLAADKIDDIIYNIAYRKKMQPYSPN